MADDANMDQFFIEKMIKSIFIQKFDPVTFRQSMFHIGVIYSTIALYCLVQTLEM